MQEGDEQEKGNNKRKERRTEEGNEKSHLQMTISA